MAPSRSDPSAGAVFLSYAREDTDAARRIADALRAAAVEVWFDQNELVGGDAWDAKIRKQIAECALFVPIISARTQARREGYFRLEWKLAAHRTHMIADDAPFLLPVAIDDTPDAEARVPAEFKAVQWTRLQSAGAETTLANRVAVLLRREASPIPPPKSSMPVLPGPAETPAVPIRVSAPAPLAAGRRSKWPWRAAVAIFVLGLGVALACSWRRGANARSVHDTMLPEIERLLATKNLTGAFDLAVAAERDAPADPALATLWPRLAVTTSVDTTPAGAEVFVKDYYQPKTEWRSLGRTPLKDVRLPKAYMRWKIQKEGHATLERALAVDAPARFNLDSVAAVPPEMVRVEGQTTAYYLMGLPSVVLGDFLIDRHEVTNRQFKEFVDAKGYENPAFWKQSFLRGDRTLSWQEALAGLRDSTGRPGPAGWKNGNYPEGEADFPVTGVSWFEAAAFAEFAGKRLPSIHHWRLAALVAEFESMVPLSNFSAKGLARVGSYSGMSAHGAYDMAGNASEWCWNSGGSDRRHLLGGAWRDATYSFASRDAQSPYARDLTYGFRCMKLIGSDPLPPEVDGDLAIRVRNYAEEKPVSDEIFQTFRRLYAYDPTPLEARSEATDDSDPRWRKEKVSFKAAYANERVPAFLFLPKNSAPPFQAVVFFPSNGASIQRSSDQLSDLPMVAMLLASGRAVIYPVYKTTYERNEKAPPGAGMNFFRDRTVMLAQDLGRAVDYLETRPDIQAGKLAFFGYSAGGTYGTILPTIESRLTVSVLVAAGLTQTRSLPETDPINFAPRNTLPTLLLNGRYDFLRPLETSQRPLFELLGAPPDQKRHVLLETSHTLKPEQIAGEVYIWLDRYLGLVK